MKNKWLVEEHKGADLGPETISFHMVVTADTAQEAFVEASKHAPTKFYFSPEELVEWVEGYAWTAYDGSSVGYEVRLIGIS